MQKIALVFLGLIAAVALVGLINLDTGTGQVYYDSYSYPSIILIGNLYNAPQSANYIVGTADGEQVAVGEVFQGAYRVTLSQGYRNHLYINFFVNGQKCNTIPVAQLLMPPQILYSGQIALDMTCTT